MSRLEYEPENRSPTHPGQRDNAALRLVSLGVLSLVGTALLVVGIMNYILEAPPPGFALGPSGAVLAMIAGASLDAVASLALFKHLKLQGKQGR